MLIGELIFLGIVGVVAGGGALAAALGLLSSM